MKIALIATLAFPIREPFAGGLEMQVSGLADELTERGHDVTLFAAPGSRTSARLYAPDVRFVDPDMEGAQWESEAAEISEANEFHAYAEIMERVGQNGFDVIHNHALFHLPPVIAHAAGAPFVMTLHTPPFVRLRAAVRQAGLLCRPHYVGISASNERTWRPWAGPHAVIQNGIRVADWTFAAEKERGAALWAGRLCKEKAPHLAIHAARAAKMRLSIAGPIYDPPYFRDHVEPLLGGDVTYIGHLEQAALAERLGRASCFVFSSMWDEPFGLVLAEALASGTPVAAFRSGASPDIIAPGCGALAPKGDVDALAAAMIEAAQCDPARCRARAESQYDIGRMTDEYEALYERVAAPARRAAS